VSKVVAEGAVGIIDLDNERTSSMPLQTNHLRPIRTVRDSFMLESLVTCLTELFCLLS
jgi:hypothetical protein